MNLKACGHEVGLMLGLAGCAALAGCGNGLLAVSATGMERLSVRGRVHGGQQPIAGANIALYAAGATGYGVGAQPLLPGGSVISGADGSFEIADSYVCPSASAQVYLVSAGGDTGSGTNDRAVLMSALGNCGDLATGSFIDMSEVSTVASVYALNQFMTVGSVSVGSSGTNVMGLNHAFAAVANLRDAATGSARALTPAGNGIVPQSKINTLANIVSTCVNTLGNSAACSELFQLATPPGGTAPTDTLAALVNIARNPGWNVTELYDLEIAQAAFQPSLTAAPKDWTLSLEFSGSGLHQGQLPAVDGLGNVWVPSHLDPGVLTEFSPTGELLSGAAGVTGGGLSYPEAVAVDLKGDIWAANEGTWAISEHTPAGTPLSGSGFTLNGMQYPYAIAVDGMGDVYTADGNNTVAKFNSFGVGQKLITGGGLDVPYAVALDCNENIWIANGDNDPQANTISEFSGSGVPAGAAAFSGGGLSVPYFVAVDGTGNVWAANFYAPTVSKMSSTGAPLSGGGYATPSEVSALAVDGDNTVWTANTDGSVSHLANSGAALSPPAGYAAPDAMAAVGLVLDDAGNVWTTDYYVDSLFEYVGAAAPVTVPMALAVKNNALGVRP